MKINNIREIYKGQVWEDGTSIYLIKGIRYQNSCPIWVSCYIYDLNGNYQTQEEISTTVFYFLEDPRYYYSKSRFSGLNLIEKLKYHYEKPNFMDGDIISINPGFLTDIRLCQ